MKKLTIILTAFLCYFFLQNAFAYVDQNVQKFLDGLNANKGKPIEELSPADARNVLINAQKSVKVNVSGIDVIEKTITVDGKSIPLTIVRPHGQHKMLPAFMFFHGGGWVLGDFQTHKRLVRDLVVGSGAVAVFVNYTPSPEAHYPVAIHQAYSATKWVSEHGTEINVDPSRLAVVGNSVGGNMVAAVTLIAKEKGAPNIKFQGLFWPVTNADFDTGSYNQFAKGYFLTRNMMKWFWDNYTTDPKQRAEIYASPLRANTKQLKDLPPALIITAGNDVLRDEGEAYAQKLDEAGVPVTSVRYNGTIHDFGLLNAIAYDAPTAAAMVQMSAQLKKYLRK